jgi:peptidoglycan/LPS O-acetylase OafA/YrhL
MSRDKPRYESLDFWRGVACLMVIVFHATMNCHETDTGTDLAHRIIDLTSYFWMGVPMFFVISGYCIAATADSSRRKQLGTIEYFRRRFRRIFPPYWAFAVISLIIACGMIALTAR